MHQPDKISAPGIQARVAIARPGRMWYTSLWQMGRFVIVGTLNTLVDILMLNLLVRIFPTHQAQTLLVYNTVAYGCGAVNSFLLNKYWTFEARQGPASKEMGRFGLITLVGVLCNNSILWVAVRGFHPVLGVHYLWAAKLVAVGGTMVVSYLGMRFWVFTRTAWTKKSLFASSSAIDRQEQRIRTKNGMTSTRYSLSVVMPAHNEEVAIAETVRSVVDAVSEWTQDFEVIVVNDGSKDCTRAILEEIATTDPRLRVINHEVNQGYGAALVSGFEATTKELVFFMDSDGQFDIHDLAAFFPLIDRYDAVLGYRIDRQDTWMRKVNAWGWKQLVQRVFKLEVRDVDCAFKLYRGRFFQEHSLETRGAMINTEILYKFKRAGYTYTQVGVQHLPRRGGRATGAKPAVIARAFRELFIFARKWHQEERAGTQSARGAY